MRIGLFFSEGVIGNVTMNSIVPQMIDLGMTPVLFQGKAARVARANTPEVKELSYLESGLLQKVVEPALLSLPQGGQQPSCLTTKQLVSKYSLDFFEVKDVNDSSFIDFLMSDKGIDGAVSIRFYPIFKQEIISKLNQKGFLWNLHSGLLPKYKGVFIPYRAIENKEEFYGWTLHHVANDIDTGAIIALDKNPLDYNKPVLDTYLDMAEKGSAMVMGALIYYQKHGELKGKEQTSDHDSYFTYPTREKINLWACQGIKFSNDIVETYLNLYTAPETLQRSFLKNTLYNVLNQQSFQQVA